MRGRRPSAPGRRRRGAQLLAYIWRHGAGWQLAALFAGGVFPIFRGAPGPSLTNQLVVGGLTAGVFAVMLYRVWAGGNIARVLLIALFLESYSKAASSLAQRWDVAVLASMALPLAAAALLVSPAIRERLRRADPPHAARALERGHILPPARNLVWSLLVGLVAPWLHFADETRGVLPGCGPADAAAHVPGRCAALLHGYPVPFLAVGHGRGADVLMALNLVKDWAHWSLLAYSVLYFIWWFRAAPLGFVRPLNLGTVGPAGPAAASAPGTAPPAADPMP